MSAPEFAPAGDLPCRSGAAFEGTPFASLIRDLMRRDCPADVMAALYDGATPVLEWLKADDAEQARLQREFDAMQQDRATSVEVAGYFTSPWRGVVVRHTKSSVWIRRCRTSEPQRFSLKTGRVVGATGIYAERIKAGTSSHPAFEAQR